MCPTATTLGHTKNPYTNWSAEQKQEKRCPTARQCASFVHSIHSVHSFVRSFVRLDDEDDDGRERECSIYIYIDASCVVRACVRKRDGTGGGGIPCSFIPVEN